MAHMNSDDELEFGPCICGHEMSQHEEEGSCTIEDCQCQYFTEDDGVAA